jgi:hypothetical protein
MTPDEYKAMFIQVYGYSPEDGNSYLYCEEKPDQVSNSEYNRYHDFSGAIQYMEDFGDVALIEDDNSSVDEFDFWEDATDEIVCTDAPRNVHVAPVPKAMCDVIAHVDNGDDYANLFVTPCNEKVDIPLRAIDNCPCFNLSCGHPVPFDKHDCEDCEWCLNVKPKTHSAAIAVLGGSLYLTDQSSYPVKSMKYPAALTSRDFWRRLDFPASTTFLIHENNDRKPPDHRIVKLRLYDMVFPNQVLRPSAPVLVNAIPRKHHAKLKWYAPSLPREFVTKIPEQANLFRKNGEVLQASKDMIRLALTYAETQRIRALDPGISVGKPIKRDAKPVPDKP